MRNIICKILGHSPKRLIIDDFSPLIFREICVCKICGKKIYDFTFWPHSESERDTLIQKFNS